MDPYQEFLIREMQRLTSRLLACQEEVWRRRTKASLTCPPFQPCALCPSSYCLPTVPCSPANRFHNCNRPGCPCKTRSVSFLPTQLTPFQSQTMMGNKTVLQPAEITKYNQKTERNMQKTKYRMEPKQSEKVILSQRESPFESVNRLMKIEPSFSQQDDNMQFHVTNYCPAQNTQMDLNSLTKYGHTSSIMAKADHQGTIFQHYIPLETSRLYKTVNTTLGDANPQQNKQTSSKPSVQQLNKTVEMPVHGHFNKEQSKLVILPVNVPSKKNLVVANGGDMPINKSNKMVGIPSRHSVGKLVHEPMRFGLSPRTNYQYRSEQILPLESPQRSNQAKPRPKSNIATHFVASSPSVPSKTQLYGAPSFLNRTLKKHNCMSTLHVNSNTSISKSSNTRINKETILPNYPSVGTNSSHKFLNQQSSLNQQFGTRPASAFDSNLIRNNGQNYQSQKIFFQNINSQNIYDSSQPMEGQLKPRAKSYSSPTKSNGDAAQGWVRPKSQGFNSMQKVVYGDSQKIRTLNSNQTVMQFSGLQESDTSHQTMMKDPCLQKSGGSHQTLMNDPSLQKSGSSYQTIMKAPSERQNSSQKVINNASGRKFVTKNQINNNTSGQKIVTKNQINNNTSGQKILTKNQINNTSGQKIVTKNQINNNTLGQKIVTKNQVNNTSGQKIVTKTQIQTKSQGVNFKSDAK